MKSREDYLKRCAKKRGDIHYNALDTDEFSGESILIDHSVDICQKVIDMIMIENAKEIISKLSTDEQNLLAGLFYHGYSEREWSDITNIPQKTINYRKRSILKKIKKILIK